ncbi:CIS tube protein [Roseateles sp. NT4]|uniref:CIS tube protein n=1 Tax=Roseateles sp. NT4 TaxID=3453715 RepID=UPI003EE83DE5
MTAPNVVKAKIVLQRNGQDIDTVEVHFNPVSLQVEITNSTSPQSGSGATTQTATQSSAKLGLDLLFDTTHTGEDVRSITRRLRAAVRSPDATGTQSAESSAAFTPPTLRFEWGTFTFTGISDSYRETLDFFSPEGVPLRSSVALALKEQPNEFSALERDNPTAANAARARSTAFEVSGGMGGAAGIAGLGGDLRAARAIASMNGEASLRFSAGATLAVGAKVELKAAVSFAGGAGVGGLGIGVGAGAGIGLSASAPSLRFDASRLAPPPAAQQLATDVGAGFSIDGRALPAGAAGLRANVGQAPRALRFDD